MLILNNLLRKRKNSTFDFSLISPSSTKVRWLRYRRDQNKNIAKLIENNNLLINSVNKLSAEIIEIKQEIIAVQSKSSSAGKNILKLEHFRKLLVGISVFLVILSVIFYIGPAFIAQVSSLSSSKILSFISLVVKVIFWALPKIVSFIVLLAIYPIFEQPEEFVFQLKILLEDFFCKFLEYKFSSFLDFDYEILQILISFLYYLCTYFFN
jgi:hypothetical protein